MSDALPALLQLLKNPDQRGAMLLLAIVIGGLVRLLRTKKAGELLDAFPAAWVKRIPKWFVPWVGIFIGFVLSVLNAKLNVGSSWLDSFGEGITGVLAGWMASGGHETIGKAAGLLLYKPFGPFNPPPKSPPPEDPPLPEAMKPDPKANAQANGADPEPVDGSKPPNVDRKTGEVKS